MFVAASLVFIVTLIYIYIKFKFRYWDRKGIQTIPFQIPFGNISDLLFIRKSYSQFFSEIYQKTKGDCSGIYYGLNPVLFAKKPEIVKDVLIRNFDQFHGRGMYVDLKREPLSGHIVRIEGPKWKSIRTKISPAFSSGKLKTAFEHIMSCGQKIQNILNDLEDGANVNFSKIIKRYTTDAICLVGFGFDANCLDDEDAMLDFFNRENKASTYLNKILHLAFHFWPNLMKSTGLYRHKLKNDQFFIDTMIKAAKYREDNGVVRNDYLNLLIDLKNKGEFGPPSEIEAMNMFAAQGYVYFIAGLETSYLTSCYALNFLSLYPEIQRKLLAEIDAQLQKNNGVLTYQSILEMEYLDMVVLDDISAVASSSKELKEVLNLMQNTPLPHYHHIKTKAILSETLRMRPILSMINRVCNKPYTIPDTDIVIEPGTRVLISILDLHMDPNYFLDPEKFNPERFSKENRCNIPASACCYLPFGEGPRICIGARHGALQTKIGLTSVLQNHSVDLCSETADMNRQMSGAVFLIPEKPIVLKISKRKIQT